MNIRYITPSIKINKESERNEQNMLIEILPNYLLNIMNKNTNSGFKTAILCSNTDGYGQFSLNDSKLFLNVAKSYFNLFEKVNNFLNKENLVVDTKIIVDATSKNLEKIIQDLEYQNIVLIGHASYHSWVASDKSVNWFQLANMTTSHLKKGLFLNVGCGGVNSWNYIPLGYFVVNNPKHLFGKNAEGMSSDRAHDFSELEQLNSPSNLIFLRELILN